MLRKGHIQETPNPDWRFVGLDDRWLHLYLDGKGCYHQWTDEDVRRYEQASTEVTVSPMTKQHIGSHGNHAKPDGKMGRASWKEWRKLNPPSWFNPSSTIKRTQKKLAAKKRRQRDRRIDE